MAIYTSGSGGGAKGQSVKDLQAQKDKNSAAWHSAKSQAQKDALHNENIKIQQQIDKMSGGSSSFNAGTGKWTTTPGGGSGGGSSSGGSSNRGGSSSGSSGSGGGYAPGLQKYVEGANPAMESELKSLGDSYRVERAKALEGDAQAYRNMVNLHDQANQIRNRYGYAAESANVDLETIRRSIYGDGPSNGGSYNGGYSGGGSVAAEDPYAEYLRKKEEEEARIRAEAEAAKRAAVEQAVGSLEGQKGSIGQSYTDLFRQLYLQRRMAEKNLPQQMAAMGYNGGLTESSALGLQTSYADALRQGEQQKISTLSDLDRAINDTRLQGDISIAEQAAQLAQQGLNSYGDIIQAQVAQRNNDRDYLYAQFLNDRDYQYQTGRDQVADKQWDKNYELQLQSMSRQQLLDEVNRADVNYERKLYAAQYLYENTGDASGLQILGYTPQQIAALKSGYAAPAALAYSGGNGGGSQGGSVTRTVDTVAPITQTKAADDPWAGIDTNSVANLNLGPITRASLEQLVESGAVLAQTDPATGVIKVSWPGGARPQSTQPAQSGWGLPTYRMP